MQPSSKEMQGVAANSHAALQELQSGGVAGHDDFLDQMMSGLGASWPPGLGSFKEAFGAGLAGNSAEDPPVDGEGIPYGLYDESSLLASRLRQHQAGVGGSPPRLLQLGQHGYHTDQQLMLLQSMGQPPAGSGGGDSGGFLRLPLSLASGGSRDLGILADRSRGEVDASFKSPNSTEADALYHSGFGESLERAIQAKAPQQLHDHAQNYGGATPTAAGTGQVHIAAQAAVSASSGGGTAPPRPRVRARRGQATDPHSIAERLRREKIAERMKALQELVPNANKTDKASMLDEIIDYVKFLQLQVKVLSMSRLGAAGAVAPLVAGMSSEAGLGRAGGKGAVGNDGVAAAEHQVAKLLEEDMGSAMQYLQGKGLCLMPISLASAISSSAVSHPRPAGAGGGLGRLNLRQAVGDAPPSPSMSVLTVQSSNGGSADGDASRTSGSKDGTPIT